MINFDKKILNSEKFRSSAMHFQVHGCYCFSPVGTTEYLEYWDREMLRSVEGYTAPDGDWISGYNYFYLNFCPILRLVEFEYKDRHGKVKMRREKTREFPDFYDYDYYYFCAIQEAEDEGSHMVVLKARGKGYSFKGGSMLDRNFYLIPNSKSYAIASETEYLVRDGLLTKAWDYMDFIDEHTAWSKKRQVTNTKMHRKASIITTDSMGSRIEVGYKSEIIGVTLKNDPNRARGKRGKLILWEEAGSFKDILQAWQIARPSVEEDGVAFGLMCAFGTGGDEGCITDNNIVFTEEGECKKISDITKSDKLIGFDIENKLTSIEPVSHINTPTKKECLYIETNTGRHIECSIDHPIYSSNKSDCNERRIFGWNNADKLVLGNLVAVSDDIPFFGKEKIFDPRLIGLIIGDGSYRKNSSVEITTCDDEIRHYIKDKYKTTSVSSYLSKEGKLVELFRVLGVKPEIHNLGINGQTKNNKRVPVNIFNSDKDSICELLGGLYDTDGCVSTILDKNRNKYSTTINLTQAGKDILQQVLVLLNKLGIHGNISFNKGRISTSGINGMNGFYKLDIRDKDSIINFHKNIKFLVKYKQDRLDLAIAKLEYINPLRVDRGFRYEKIKSILNVGLKTIYNLTANNTNTYLVNGIITHNSRFDGLKELFYNPSGYNVQSFSNIWDEGADGNVCAFFVPVYANMSVLDESGKRMFMDKNGNSSKVKAIDYSMVQRQKVIDGSSDSRAIDRYIAENPITPQEAVLELTGNIFPKKELMNQLAALRTNKKLQSHKQVGELNYVNGGLNWTIKKSGDITKYPLGRDDKHEGSIVIWEHPAKDTSNQLYIAGCDPYDHDKAGTNSLGATFIYKRFQNFEQYYDILVAEYTGRPDTAEEYYENVRKLLVYYNARLLYENERKGIFPYFTQKHCDYLLADQPDIINDIIGKSTVQRRKGIHMNVPIKDYGEGMIKEYLNQEYAPGKKCLTTIFSEPLLEELIKYNDKGNFDRVIALMMVLIYKQQLHNLHVKKRNEEVRKNNLFDKPLFSKEWFGSSNDALSEITKHSIDLNWN